MLNILEILEMRREFINGILVIGLIYGINYVVQNLIVFTINEKYENEIKDQNENEIKDDSEDKILDDCDLQLEKLDELEDDKKKLLDNKMEYLMNLNNKLENIKTMLQDIKGRLHNK